MKTILFYSSVKTKKMFSIQSYYRNDILILRDLGYKVKLSNSALDFLKFWQYDVSFLYFYRYSLFPAVLSKLFLKKNFFTGGIDYLDKSFATPKERKIQKIFFKLCTLFSNCNILVSTTDRENVAEIYNGKLPKKCDFSYHVVNMEQFVDYSFISRKEKIILTIGWMVQMDNVYRKGIDRTVIAFKKFLEQHGDFKLVIAGPPGVGSKYVLDLIDRLGLKSHVEYLGVISEQEKIRLLRKSMIYSQLSKYEGFGIACIEALAAANIVVHSGNGGLKDAVGSCGIIVDIDNIDSVVDGYKKAYDVYQTNLDIQMKGIDYVKKKFSYNVRLEDFKRILSK